MPSDVWGFVSAVDLDPVYYFIADSSDSGFQSEAGEIGGLLLSQYYVGLRTFLLNRIEQARELRASLPHFQMIALGGHLCPPLEEESGYG